jgi:FKBP-type peptidyl-prolyl cis-trans isomerase
VDPGDLWFPHVYTTNQNPADAAGANAFGRWDRVETLPSGLQYKILKAGDSNKPTEADTVVCHYRGTLTSGTEFDIPTRAMSP